MKKLLRIIMNTWMLLLSTSSVLIYRGIELGRSYGLSTSEWASWVQAVGSITALLVAIFVMSRQNAHAQRLVVQADGLAISRRAAAVHALVVHAELRLGVVLNAIARPSPSTQAESQTLSNTLRSTAKMLGDNQKVVEAIPIYELGSYDMADGVHTIGEVLRVLSHVLEGLADMPEQLNDPQMSTQLSKQVEQFKAAVLIFRRGMDSINADIRQ